MIVADVNEIACYLQRDERDVTWFCDPKWGLCSRCNVLEPETLFVWREEEIDLERVLASGGRWYLFE